MPEPRLDSPPAAPALDPPAAVTDVAGDQAANLVPLTSDARARLADRARSFVDDLLASDPRSPDFARKVTSIETMGAADLRASSQVASSMLARPAPQAGGATGRVSALLGELRGMVTELDPERVEWEPARGVRRLLPGGGDPATRYFGRYRSAQARLDELLTALLAGQDELRRDNATIEAEKAGAQATLSKLSEYAVLAAELDDAVSSAAGSLIASGRADAADVLRSEALAAVRRRRQDVLTALAVAVQGYLALDVVRRNNVELVKAVELARVGTIRALRAAVAASAAVAQQSLVLDQIRGLDAAAAAAGAGGGDDRLDALRSAFGDLRATMEAIDGYRDEATTNMTATVDALAARVGSGPAAAGPAAPEQRGA